MFETILCIAAGLTAINSGLNALSNPRLNNLANTYVMQKIDIEKEVIVYKNFKTGDIKEEPFNEFRERIERERKAR